MAPGDSDHGGYSPTAQLIMDEKADGFYTKITAKQGILIPASYMTAIVNDTQETHGVRWCLVPDNLAQLHATVRKLDNVMKDFPGMPNLSLVNRTRDAVAKIAGERADIGASPGSSV